MNEKPPLPDALRQLAAVAQTRVKKLGATAPLGDIVPGATGDYMASPYADDDWELWACLLLDTFGTRNFAVAHAFMRQLGSMIPHEWDGTRQVMTRDVELFQLALSIICSLRPRDEAEAAIAVHCVALHLATYKVTNHLQSRSWLDPKTGAALAAITKAYAAQVKALRDMQKPARAKRQIIKVQKSVTVNYVDARQVHLPDRGSGDSGNQPDATRALRAGARAGEPLELAALPSPNKAREVLPLSGGARKTGVPNARRAGRSAEGRTERRV